MSKFLVTGGAGFIGSHIATKLVHEGHSVKIIDNFSSGDIKNLAGIIGDIEIIEGDIRDLDTLNKVLKGVQYVYHEAAIASVQKSIEFPIATNQINIDGTINILEAARKTNVQRVIFASSAACYGDSGRIPKDEEMLPDPLSPYALQKLCCEHYLKIYNNLYGIETVALRYFNVYGPRQNPSSPYSGVISIFVDKMMNGLIPTIFGDGEQTRDFVYIDDIVDANLRAAFSNKVGLGEVINIASGKEVTLNELIDALNRVLNTNIKPQYLEKRQGDILRSVADISKANKLLGYNFSCSLKVGLKLLVESLANVF